jgi:O-antigen ligase
MAVALVRRWPIAVPPGFGWWLLFLVWSLAGILVLGVNPPGTVVEGAGDRIIGYATRQVQYLSATVILLYVGNLRESELPKRTVVNLLAWMYALTAAGGVLGTIAPRFGFTSPFEMILPAGIAQNAYVQNLVHPAAAQVQDLLGTLYPRAKAPWDYTNTWGFMIVFLAPFFVVAMTALARRRRPVLAGVLLTVGVVCAIGSLNRGTWILMAVAVVVVVVRLAVRGRTDALVGVMIASVLAGLLIVASPLKGLVEERLDNGRSNAIREQTSTQTIQIVSESPIIGYGSTRSAAGSNQTITAGRSATCPACGNAVLGSNGFVFLLLVSTGVVGTFFFLMFFVGALVRWRGDHSPIGSAAFLAILLTLISSLFYDVGPNVLAFPVIALALLWRNQRDASSTAPAATPLASRPRGGPA